MMWQGNESPGRCDEVKERGLDQKYQAQ